ncbi:hypothetical protein [Pseudodesulfovibrio sp. zrk46]|uniref:hypothetical protein n=1 Tax=Pseudodesulfovibrio sp. zrk46 TaxID=2725288 RepID=UPI0014498FCF|nr:hypothetical protein [Pseudodesulfovibrio sp. zrk46]QJB55648.1 hypothetical protein HFN16_04205 [Pseudodesulfovibrio sp. zrk46]
MDQILTYESQGGEHTKPHFFGSFLGRLSQERTAVRAGHGEAKATALTLEKRASLQQKKPPQKGGLPYLFYLLPKT